MIFRPVLQFSFFKFFSNGVLSFFFLAWDQFFSKLRDVWDERVLKPLNSHEKIIFKLQIRAFSPNNRGP
jgi:hypothetical protein